QKKQKGAHSSYCLRQNSVMDFALFETFRGFNSLAGDSKLDDDFVDRLNRYWTSLIMVMFAIILSAKQIVGEPLKCWTPQEFKDPWIQYAEDYCWVKNTYFVPKSEELSPHAEVRKTQEIGYYQWIPYVMTLQAFCYYFPAMVWRMFNWKCGLDLPTIVSRAVNRDNLDGVGFQLSSNLLTRMDSERNSFFFQRSFLTCLYLITKLLYSVNSLAQFFILSSFFGRATDSLFSVTRDLALGVEWHESGHFPRITFCDFSIRRLGNINNYSIQCVLAINIFTEKIFVFAGFWMLLVAIVTVLHSFGWLTALLLPWRRRGFVAQLNSDPDVDRFELEDFTDNCLGSDGLLVFQLIAANADERTASHLLGCVWREFGLRRTPDDSVDNDAGDIPLMPTAGSETLQLPSREAEPSQLKTAAEYA
uniref:Innexin n=1 Tax=Macrostomum lignano TaxID=282301 RepID=A0A1I8I9V4_9PLAT